MKISVIPDCQVKPGVDLSYLTWIGKYLAEKKPDVIVCIGDFADMESLSLYDVGKKSFEGRTYKADLRLPPCITFRPISLTAYINGRGPEAFPPVR